MNFDDISAQLKTLRLEIESAELHGLVTGWLAAGAKWSVAEANEALTEWFGGEEVSAELVTISAELAKEILAELEDLEMGFQLLLPDDGASITVRQQNLSHWCTGFLSGFGITGRFQQKELADDVAEVFRDMARIATLDDEIPDDDDNESDLMEISEYVRMSALYVFTECANKAVH